MILFSPSTMNSVNKSLTDFCVWQDQLMVLVFHTFSSAAHQTSLHLSLTDEKKLTIEVFLHKLSKMGEPCHSIKYTQILSVIFPSNTTC